MLKVLDKVENSIVTSMSKRVQCLKNEDIAYVGSFLAILRNKLLQYHSRSLKEFPNKGIKFYL
jgi:hypothetical protein